MARAPALGAGGREFESHHPDHAKRGQGKLSLPTDKKASDQLVFFILMRDEKQGPPE